MKLCRLRLSALRGVCASQDFTREVRALTIGNFDGVHLGHRQMIARVVERAKARGLLASVMIFEPQPGEFFQGARKATRIARLHEKVAALKGLGLDEVIVVSFNAALARFSAQDFVAHILQKTLQVRYLLIGDDFRFGAGRAGDYAFLNNWFRGEPFEVEQLSQIQSAGERISSTRIRLALSEGRLADAQRLLGRPYCLSAKVVKGQQLGRRLGFPTANLHLTRPTPLSGVFVARVHLADGRQVYGMCNVGLRPSVEQSFIQRVEVHLFDFNEDLYGQRLQLECLHFLRPEQRFDSLDSLTAQIAQDQKASLAFLKAAHLG